MARKKRRFRDPTSRGRDANPSAHRIPEPTRLRAFALWLAALVAMPLVGSAREFHVSVQGSDSNPGTRRAPLRTIQRAADLARPGDVITVHEGVYRERIHPPRGGASDRQRIVYRAAPGERVEIKGSEVVKGWTRVQDDVWKVTLPNAFFGDFNPFTNIIRGDWFNPKGRVHHTGAVYLNGDWLVEAAAFEDVFNHPPTNAPLWFAQVDPTNTTIWAQFPGVNPNEHLVEVNARRAVFYPDQPGRNYITVRGFILRHAATQWAPPTAEQIGLIGTHWSKGWIIESNVVSHSICVGIALGKHGDEFDNTSANTAEGYVKTIERAHAFRIPWTREHIGHHVVRGNHISHCEQAGIVGSLGCAFSLVEGNVIHDIHVRRLFTGAEMAGIKFHGAIDTVIRRNHIYRTCRGLWLDWMAQGTRVTQNLLHDNAPSEDLFVEVNHGPFLVDNNIFLSPANVRDVSEGGAYVHNLFTGDIINRPEPRRDTPYHPAHSTTVAGLAKTTGGDNRFYNNLFIGNGQIPSAEERGNLKERRWISSYGLWGYDGREFPIFAAGNVYLHGAQPSAQETEPLVRVEDNPEVRLVEENGRWYLHLAAGEWTRRAQTALVTTERLGSTRVAGLAYENPDGSPLRLDTDYFGRRRNSKRPTPGPFEVRRPSELRLRVW